MTHPPAASSMPPEPALADGPELDPDVVVVDDSRTNRTVLHALLRAEGYRVRVEESGDAALPFLRALKRPVVGLIDWEMPGRSGIEVCAELRAHWNTNPLFLILLTARAGPDDIVKGLRSGANDYITKPFNPPELLARVRIGNAMVMLQQSLAKRVTELEAALAENRQLHGLLPIEVA